MESIGSYMGAAGVDMAGLDATELRLGLPGTTSSLDLSLSFKSKRPREEDDELSSKSSCCSTTEETSSCCNDNHRSAAEVPPPAKSQVVGWPPVQSFRVRCSAASQGKKAADGASKKEAPAAPGISSSGLLVKVSMDGAPYLRKIDLGSYKGYKDLRMALDAMFGCFSTTASVHHQVQNIMTYEDKDGDWMLVGDVPWEMFTASCKRLRIMKGSSSESRA